jgi:hypothetical protein
LITGLFLLLLDAQPTTSGPAFDPAALAKEQKDHSFVTIPAPCLGPDRLGPELERLASTHAARLEIEAIGNSFHGKEIRMISIGHGPRSILLWSQMHGDEPTATPALLDVADFLAREASMPEVARILDAFTLRMIPMLNPDGAAVYERRNAQGIDINRDALMLATPEGRLLKSIRDRFSPILGFNLHDQGRRVTVGDTGVLSSISLLAVAGDEKGTITPGRLRAKRVASRIVRVLAPLVPGGIARYDEDWNPRAFGDNITAWGTPVVLIESGGFPEGSGFRDLTRLNFVALVSTLAGLAANDLADETPDLYDALRRNRPDAYADVALGGVSILEPRARRWFEADLAFDRLASDQAIAGCAATARTGSRVVEVGDSRIVKPGRRIDGRGMLVAPLSRDLGLRPGEITRGALLALRPGVTSSSPGPRDFLSALRLSETALARNGAATFVVFIPDREGQGAGRYFAVIDGLGLPEGLR